LKNVKAVVAGIDMVQLAGFQYRAYRCQIMRTSGGAGKHIVCSSYGKQPIDVPFSTQQFFISIRSSSRPTVNFSL
jgi:hypothetical protein